jgi:hypothetical protein
MERRWRSTEAVHPVAVPSPSNRRRSARVYYFGPSANTKEFHNWYTPASQQRIFLPIESEEWTRHTQKAIGYKTIDNRRNFPADDDDDGLYILTTQ